jgi:predicted adenylyl cyclase CyaB
MARNIEIKARIASVSSLVPIVANLVPDPPVLLVQDDTFFRCDNGRIKLRAFSETSGELIFYRRADNAGPKESFYVRAPTQDPQSLKDSLTLAYGVIGQIRKTRRIYLSGRTRIHLDEVENLGDFLELEVVLADGESAQSGINEAQELMAQLGIRGDQLIDGAYLDMMASANAIPQIRGNLLCMIWPSTSPQPLPISRHISEPGPDDHT